MHLNKLIIFNYRSCQHLVLDFSENSPNIYIGLNDSGKSTVLNAINLLLSDKPKYSYLEDGNYKSDLSNSIIELEEINKFLSEQGLPNFDYEEPSTLILGELLYKDEETEKYLDLNLTTALQWSLESSEDNTLWLGKRFSSSGVHSYLLGAESKEPLNLWTLAQAAINKEVKLKAVSKEDIENENGKGRFSNFEKIRAIYDKLECSTIWISYKSAKSDKEILPKFSLFDWNASLDEVIAAANAIMQDEIEEHLTPIKNLAQESAEKAEIAINKKFGEISTVIRQVAKDVENISSRVYFDVRERISDIMLTKTYSDGPIHLENQGEGLKRQIWFSLIKAKANEDKEGANNFIWAFDEPETHLYPGAQREFFDILNKISAGNVQAIISTHSTIFIDKSHLNKINSVKQNDTGYTEINFCKDIESIFSTLNVKNSDFLFYNKFLIVEGDTEQYLIPKLYQLYTDRTLISDNIQIINIQGKNNWTKNKGILDSVLGDFKKTDDQIIYLFDNDMSFEIGESAKLSTMFFVGDQDIEDAIDISIWRNALNSFYFDILDFTEDEIRNVKSDVVKGGNCNDHEKFYPLLKKMIKHKCGAEGVNYDTLKRIPSKGSESADFIYGSISKVEFIPKAIIGAFDKLQ